MSSIGEEFRNKLPRLAANMALALAFGAIGALSSVALNNVTEGVGFYSWLVLTLVGGAFLVRALFDVLAIGDKTVESFLRHIGVQKRWSRRRIAKDLMCIIATILATAAILPFFETLGTVETALQSATSILATGIIFLFIYDIARTLHRIFQEKASALTNWLVRKQNEEMK